MEKNPAILRSGQARPAFTPGPSQVLGLTREVVRQDGFESSAVKQRVRVWGSD
jgi:hypothetical protein